MEQIYVIGDIHTVSAFRLSGVTGVVSDRQDCSRETGGNYPERGCRYRGHHERPGG